eukprot:scaffold43826_cov32-Tisochrysis_lutea.AAC.1
MIQPLKSAAPSPDKEADDEQVGGDERGTVHSGAQGRREEGHWRTRGSDISGYDPERVAGHWYGRGLYLERGRFQQL